MEPLAIKQTQEGLFAKKFSTVEIVENYLKRINKNNDRLNIFLTVTSDEARAGAKRTDNLIGRYKNIEEARKDFPLFGVVVAHKDLFLTRGVRTTAGSKLLTDYMPQYSASVVNRLEDAGAIMIGKVNCDAWAHGSSGENSDFGSTKNPWNEEYVPGGSSSGSGAAVASGLSAIATGTDTGGSIRMPASFCGVVGLKPTYGAVSRYGVIAMASSLDSVGHFTLTTDDSKMVFDITRGEDGKDSTVKSEISKQKSVNSKLRIGIPKEFLTEGVDSQVAKTVAEAVNVFKKDGVEFKQISLPHTKYGNLAYYIIQPAEVSSNLARYDGIRYGHRRSVFGDESKRRIMLGTYVLSAGYYDAYYLKAMKVRSKIIEDFNRVFDSSADGVDAIIAPVSPTPPFKAGEKIDDPIKMYLADVFTVSANLAGIPALALPFGFSTAGLPLGFQLMGHRFGENLLFELGRRFEQLTDFTPKIAID
ncbi:glutaminyl-tRNA synthase (glutamine-hydrolyzing) subunit A [Candidatus Woesebacteria bacterium GWB1_43_5]|uniref:Glutamyl-tRNA(Gln) amidotransferase subunit A n=1 Tax=Candidatus Woesebacteria bacterium GWB1_43_5 TaxID=1802474 RepID=A0A1F7WRU5_9BACT|nr:MAG: glutaminyl-tRNA synthase (glutamine-hydrolyzing) subunit A [Candidatus Woesebacteria bacterium GWB1_43_5]